MLVTGGAGFIGSHVVEELLACNYEVIIVDNLTTGFERNISKEAIFYNMDINQPEIECVFEQEKPDYIIHLAAQVSVQASMDNPHADFNTNTAGTVRLLTLAKQYNVKRLVFSSTAAVYGEPSYLPIDEHHLTHPQSYYSLSKFTAEKYIEFYGKYNKLNYCILRFSNVYGPRQNANGEAGVVSIFIDRLLASDELKIFDGSQTRDFVYVKDVARACRLSLGSHVTGVFNISSQTKTEIGNLYRQIVGLTGENRLPLYERIRQGEVMESVLDNTKAKQEFEWSTHYGLAEGLNETVKFYTDSLLNK